MEVYLDNAATTRVCKEAADIAYKVMTEDFGNPSSTHTKGREAKTILDAARKNVAVALGCAPSELYFTSGGSESDNWALFSGAEGQKRNGKHIISSVAEHSAVRRALDELERRGFEVTQLAPEEDGSVSVAAVMDALREDTILVSLMLVNNEVGAISDVSAISKAMKKAGSGAVLHTDAVQAFLKLPFSAKTLGADMISISGHKIHAPKGIGALYVKDGLRLAPYLVGGAQEGSRRAGTEAMPLITAFGEAVRIGHEQTKDSNAHMLEIREHIISRLTAENPGLLILGAQAPHILCISLPGYRSEVLMNFLEAKRIYVSKSSACKRGGRSHVLVAMGLPAPVIDGALRVGLSRFSTMQEADAFCNALYEARTTLAHS